jgi:hypothetical protein
MNPSRIASKLRGECSYHTPIRVVLSTKKLGNGGSILYIFIYIHLFIYSIFWQQWCWAKYRVHRYMPIWNFSNLVLKFLGVSVAVCVR